MKRHINKLLLLGGFALALSSCDDNSWNDKLPGFEEPEPSQVESIDYTLTANDYKLVAANSANKALAGSDKAKALAAVGTQGYFSEEIPAADYIPGLLNDYKFQYFTLENGSAMNITYRTATALPEEIKAIAAAEKYAVDEADYQSVWKSDEDYTLSFAPSHTAARSIPGILKAKFPDAVADDYVIVNYNTSDTDPVFNTPDEPAFELSDVLGSISKGDNVEINGYVAAVSTQGPVVVDASGSVFAYQPTGNSALKVGDQVTMDATIDSYNYGFQVKRNTEVTVKGTQTVTYPAAKTWTGTEVDQFVADAMASGAAPISPVYSKFTGKVKVDGNYINISLDGTTVQLSPYGASDAVKAALTDGATVTLEGYAMAIASKGKFLNIIVTKVGDTGFNTLAAAAASRAVVTVPSVNENAIYKFDGSEWAAAPSTVILSHADYQAMGQSHDNFSGDVPSNYMPIMLKNRFPYADTDDTMFVAYYYYDSNSKATTTRCDQYLYNGSEWTLNDGVVTETAQFVKSNGKWNYDPSMVITLPSGRGVAISTLYFQTCVDWVRNNVTDGAAYISSYGNNEYYCGTSAYQGNVDMRPGSAKEAYAGYASMSDDEVMALMKKRFETEVMPGALAILHSDMKPIDGIDVTVTINFYYYTADRKTLPATVVYEVTAPATFTFVSCTWND